MLLWLFGFVGMYVVIMWVMSYCHESSRFLSVGVGVGMHFLVIWQLLEWVTKANLAPWETKLERRILAFFEMCKTTIDMSTPK